MVIFLEEEIAKGPQFTLGCVLGVEDIGKKLLKGKRVWGEFEFFVWGGTFLNNLQRGRYVFSRGSLGIIEILGQAVNMGREVNSSYLGKKGKKRKRRARYF